jgi:hypothetical protein
MNIPDHISESLKTIFGVKIPKFFFADPDLGSLIFLTLDPGWKKFGSEINIPDSQHCFPTTCVCGFTRCGVDSRRTVAHHNI